MAKIIGTKGQYDTDQGFTTKRSSDGETQIFDKNGNFVDSVVDENKAGNRGSKSYKFWHPQQQKQEPASSQDNANNAAKEGVNRAGSSIMSAAETALKQKPVSSPMAQHNVQQAALAQNQAAQLKAQQQQANQIANRTSTTTGAMNEAQKVAEQSALQKQRLAAQQMAGDAGLANAAAAKAGAEVDPSQHFSEMQALGSQERARAVDLGKSAASMASTAESQRALTTSDVENRQQAAEWNAKAQAANEANAALEQERYDREIGLREKQINAEAAKNEAEAGKSQQETEKVTEEQSMGLTDQLRAMLKNPKVLDPKTFIDRYISLWKKDTPASNQLIKEASQIIGPNSAYKAVGKAAYDYWVSGPGESAPDESKNWMQQMLVSDNRMKTIETPVGHALMNIWKGRTI